jgi:hypothetical protein
LPEDEKVLVVFLFTEVLFKMLWIGHVLNDPLLESRWWTLVRGIILILFFDDRSWSSNTVER